MTISDEAVEAAAKGILATPGDYPGEEQAMEWAKHIARAALESAAPNMFAPVLELADQWQEDFPYKANQLRKAISPNPYRSQG